MHHLFYAPDIESGTNIIHLSEAESRHAIKSLRMNEGDPIHVTDGEGKLAKGIIKIISRKEVLVEITDLEYKEKPCPEIILGLALIKPSRFEVAVEKVTELGVSAILPLQSRYVVHQQFKRERLENIMVSAMKQSLSVYKPVLWDPVNLSSLPDFVRENEVTQIIYFDKHGKDNLNYRSDHEGKILYLIGPEGGFSEQEEELIRSMSAQIISLSGNRLRAETAAIAGLVKIQADLNKT